MEQKNFDAAKRSAKRLERLGTNDPRCCICGNSDDRVLDLHHPAQRKHDDLTVISCANCHRILSDGQRDHPIEDYIADPLLAAIGHFLLGLADMLRLIVERLVEFGHALIAMPPPKPEPEQ